jgi:hypothetical protein
VYGGGGPGSDCGGARLSLDPWPLGGRAGGRFVGGGGGLPGGGGRGGRFVREVEETMV